MAKAVWIAGMLVGASTAVSTVMPHEDAQAGWSSDCIQTVMADVSTCVSGPAASLSPATMNIGGMPFSLDLPTAPTPDAI
jgi:hypothetical protein